MFGVNRRVMSVSGMGGGGMWVWYRGENVGVV